MSSGYEVPVFISSTVYDLVDLRAEVQEHLVARGFKPVLSSDEGFPDRSPTLEPWESCLPVLAKCFVVIVIIDGRYGQRLKWPNSGPALADREISATHAEYLFARQLKKRVFLFVRERVLEFYQSYRQAKKLSEDGGKNARSTLEPLLPPGITFEALEFLEEAKTLKPITWMRPFKDSRELRVEIERKMINELHEYYSDQHLKLEEMKDRVLSAIEELPVEGQRQFLSRLGIGKALIEAAEKSDQDAAALRAELNAKESAKEELQRKLGELADNNVKDRKALEKQIQTLKAEAAKLGEKLDEALQVSRRTILGGMHAGLSDWTPTASSVFAKLAQDAALPHNRSPVSSLFLQHPDVSAGLKFTSSTSCDRCNALTLGLDPLKKCPECRRSLCSRCWHFNDLTGLSSKCPDCDGKSGIGALVGGPSL